MNADEIAIMRAIQSSPDDDLPRLIYADYCQENPTDWRLATEEFIRLSVVNQKPQKERTQTSICTACANGKIEEWVSIPIGHALRDCPRCNGSGMTKIKYTPRQQLPKKASAWLRENWRRLLPRLTREWDKAIELSSIDLGYPWPPIDLGYPWRESIPCGQMTQLAAGLLRVSVPFILPTYHEPGYRCYTCTVNLRFFRGFLEGARWTAPSLGRRIADALMFDQPLAHQIGPGAILDPLSSVSSGECLERNA